MKIFTKILFVLCAMSGAAHAQSISQRAQQDDVVFMQDEEPAMRRAFELARASLDAFLAKAKAPAAGTDSYAVKVGIRDGKNTEYFWLNELEVRGERFTGRVNNEPGLVKTVAYGQVYHFTKAQIVDWTYNDRSKKKMMGNFTACALLSKEPKKEAEAFKKQYGLSCD